MTYYYDQMILITCTFETEIAEILVSNRQVVTTQIKTVHATLMPLRNIQQSSFTWDYNLWDAINDQKHNLNFKSSLWRVFFIERQTSTAWSNESTSCSQAKAEEQLRKYPTLHAQYDHTARSLLTCTNKPVCNAPRLLYLIAVTDNFLVVRFIHRV